MTAEVWQFCLIRQGRRNEDEQLQHLGQYRRWPPCTGGAHCGLPRRGLLGPGVRNGRRVDVVPRAEIGEGQLEAKESQMHVRAGRVVAWRVSNRPGV